MIPVCLNLRNFMSYTDVHEPLRFDGIHVAVLSGDNGHGKSALLDAMTWALWGESRARTTDDLIHTGKTDMEVEFEFLLDGQQYRVIRKRQKRGKTGVSDLQFTVHTGGGVYRPLTERSVQETQRAIVQTLRMSYDTFTNSSFIQQGHADRFTTNQPAERKRILAEILELGIYDDLESRAKDLMNQRKAQVQDERARNREWEQEIARRPEYQAEAERQKEQLAVLEARLQELDAEVKVSRERLVRQEVVERTLRDLEERRTRFEADRAREQARLEDVRKRLAAAKLYLDRADAIERAAAEWATLRTQLEVAERKVQAYLPLAQARQVAQGHLDAERARLESNIQAHLKQITEQKKDAARLNALEAEQPRAVEEAAQLQRVAEERARLQQEAITLREQTAQMRQVNEQLREEMFSLRGRLDEIETLTTCPACQQPLDQDHKFRLRRDYEAQGKELKGRYRENDARCKELELRVQRDDARLAELAQILGGREAAQRRLAALERDLAHTRQAADRLDKLQAELMELETVLKEERFAPEARAALSTAERELADLDYDLTRHEQLRKNAEQYRKTGEDQQLLARAREKTQEYRELEAAIQAGVTRFEEELAGDAERLATLRAEQAQLLQESGRLQLLEAEQAGQREACEAVRVRHVHALSKVDHCSFLERRLEESVARQDAWIREQSIYSDLAMAFGRRGVQAMIIESAIPEIEEEANDILARMTDGRMHVRFETQRDARSGSSVIETLDIKIADELGTRGYEMFSGGESFRVNFAIRIALSKLLANRAGTRLQLLVIDEGFGSQDAEGRDRIVEAIQAIQDEFEKILIITHLEDLRERFPVRIDVRKTPGGSVYALQ